VTSIQLPTRAGERPTASQQLPHSQLDQQPSDGSLSYSIIDEAAGWPHVRQQESGISVEGARAVVLDAEVASGAAGAFMVGTEFCHAHAQGDFSFHAMLPIELAREAERAGWAEPHYLVRTGQVPPNLVMIYAPRDAYEQDVVRQLVRAAYEHALAATS
jgi:phospholipase/carboxylesterase